MATERQKLSAYAITISTFQQHRHFQVSTHAERFISTLFRYRQQGKFLLHGFVVMPDHVHVLITPARDQSTARCIQLIKGGYSHAAQSDNSIWHSGYYEHRIRDPEDFSSQLAYMAHNPNQPDYPYVHTRYPDHLDPTPL